VRARVQPRIAAAHDLDIQLTQLQLPFVDIGNL
jgi:hypothetical protein